MKRSRSRVRLFLLLSVLGSFLFSLEAAGSADAPEEESAEARKKPLVDCQLPRGYATWGYAEKLSTDEGLFEAWYGDRLGISEDGTSRYNTWAVQLRCGLGRSGRGGRLVLQLEGEANGNLLLDRIDEPVRVGWLF